MDVAIGQASVFASPTPSISRGATTARELSAGMFLSLVRVTTLDDAVEEREWGSIHTEVGVWFVP